MQEFKLSTFDEIESIDEAAEKLDMSMEDETIAYKFNIPPDCSKKINPINHVKLVRV